jgi:hypothetical protein
MPLDHKPLGQLDDADLGVKGAIIRVAAHAAAR